MTSSLIDIPMLEMRNVTKEFPGVRALDNISFSINTNEVHALVGENGAGKSTLIKILAGVYSFSEYTGQIFSNGQEVKFRTVKDSEKEGIAVIYQELASEKFLSVAENIFLGDEPKKLGFIDWNQMFSSAQKLIDEYGFSVDVQAPMNTLGIGEQQLVEIAKALRKRGKILILDEPTAALSEKEVELLFKILKNLRDKGVSMLYVSHKLDEIFEIADRATVFRDGKSVATAPVSQWSKKELIKNMVGRELKEIYPVVEQNPGKKLLEVENLSVADTEIKGNYILKNVSLFANEGEILGMSGLIGAGRSEFLLSLFGSPPGIITSGKVRLGGKKVNIRYPNDAIKFGIALVPEDRKNMGLVLGLPIVENLSMVQLDDFINRGFINNYDEFESCKKVFDELSIRAFSLSVLVETLSGGNQQKVVFGKWMIGNPKILLLDEPTRGVDVGAKVEIYKLMNDLKKKGACIIFVSSELPEVLGVSDRIIVFRRGEIAGQFLREEATQEKIMELAT